MPKPVPSRLQKDERKCRAGLSATAGLTCLVEVAVAYKFSFQNLRQQHSAVPVFIAAVHIVNIYFT